MKRFLLFFGYNDLYGGGWRDFKGSFDTSDEADKHASLYSWDWMQIVDTNDGMFSTTKG